MFLSIVFYGPDHPTFWGRAVEVSVFVVELIIFVFCLWWLQKLFREAFQQMMESAGYWWTKGKLKAEQDKLNVD